ncbi:MAG: prepilin-type N-terminal cleavage/methylation domain-containing protein [Pirellulaceae bacterium]|jgi:prepilin-type N-terminal cleavage/methylation domain-containing protein
MSIRRKRAFTLVEMLVVISIIGLLAALLMPAIQQVREVGRQTHCLNNQRQIGQAINAYAATKRKLPPLRSMTKANSGQTVYAMSWVPPMLAELGYGALLDRLRYIDDNVPNDIPDNIFELSSRLETLTCTSDPTLGDMRLPGYYSDARVIDLIKSTPTSYVLNGGLRNRDAALKNTDYRANGVFDDLGVVMEYGPGGVPLVYRPAARSDMSHIRDGQANTIACSENVNAYSWVLATEEVEAAMLWQPIIPDPNPNVGVGPPVQFNQELDVLLDPANGGYARPSSRHPNTFIVAFVDSHTRRISEQIDYFVWCRLMTSEGQKTRDPSGSSSSRPFPDPYQGRPYDANELD